MKQKIEFDKDKLNEIKNLSTEDSGLHYSRTSLHLKLSELLNKLNNTHLEYLKVQKQVNDIDRKWYKKFPDSLL